MSDAKIKARLIQELALLSETESIADAAAQTVELDQSKVGRLSRMDALQQQAMSQEQNRRRELQVKRIKAALRRIDNGEYGYCINCGEEINSKRLDIDPAAAFCIRCADGNQ